MSSSEKPTTKIFIGVTTTLVVAAVLYFAREFLPPFLSWIWGVITAGWTWLFTPHYVLGWLIIVLTGALLSLILHAGRWVRKAKAIQKVSSRDFRESVFNDVLWRWDYDSRDRILNLTSFCPDRTCDMQIYPK